jgi:hypothetical protein
VDSFDALERSFFCRQEISWLGRAFLLLLWMQFKVRASFQTAAES